MNQSLTNISVIKDLFSRHGFSFTKSLGQNFLINPSICPRMANSLNELEKNGTVLEIGGGVGVLTCELSKVCEKVILIEIDEKLKPILCETLGDCDNINIIWGDALKIIHNGDFSATNDAPIAVVANLPYYIATHIIMQLFESGLPLTSITAMVQEEVAQRFIATKGSKQYGIISIAANFYSKPKMLFKVSRGSFMPAPNVDSAVIRFDLKDKNSLPQVCQKQFFRLVKSAFSERRKQLCNPVSKEFAVNKDWVKSILKNPNARAEDLSLDEFLDLHSKLNSRE
ncbi:MAG: 16S rRNA (adenine(1518)-N(6)/adenine(1519)-N(6))-dimethyltransferase RsmA [Oscillospiraceae bacterium]|nr:16S rRNA (adenine(1518)-N(6)/adenine(1519)-N(6))-dimethyltransferase RsmA [Oscillospiraceae bacterium]